MIIVEGFVFFGLRLSALLILSLGLASLASWSTVKYFPQLSDAAWVDVITQFAARLGAVFSAIGVLMFFLVLTEGKRRHSFEPGRGTGPWYAIPGLIALPLLTLWASRDFVSFLQETQALLDSWKIWEQIAQAGQFSGLLLTPLLGMLVVLLFQIAAILAILFSSAALLLLLWVESTRFRRASILCGLTLSAFVAGSFLALDLTSAVFPQLTNLPGASGVREMTAFKSWVQRHDLVTKPVTRGLAWLLLAYWTLAAGISFALRTPPVSGEGSREPWETAFTREGFHRESARRDESLSLEDSARIRRCVRCTQVVDPGSRFCPSCGMPLSSGSGVE